MNSSLPAGGNLPPQPAFFRFFRRLLQYIHRRRYHRHYYIDWPYVDPPVRMGTCHALGKKNCGYHWEKVVE